MVHDDDVIESLEEGDVKPTTRGTLKQTCMKNRLNHLYMYLFHVNQAT